MDNSQNGHSSVEKTGKIKKNALPGSSQIRFQIKRLEFWLWVVNNISFIGVDVVQTWKIRKFFRLSRNNIILN